MSSEEQQAAVAPIDVVAAKDWTPLYVNAFDYSSAVVLEAEVVHGFKRGSKELGIPTANLSMADLGEEGAKLDTGIYYGTATVNEKTYQAVVSVGWNPFYKNVEKTIEAHLLQEMEDFYGERIRVELVGYLRAEANFNGLEELISCINYDIKLAKERLREKRVDLKE